MKGRFEMGRRLLKLLGSAPDFFRIGVTAAVLKAVGTVPEDREECRIAEIKGRSEGREDLTKDVGRGSS